MNKITKIAILLIVGHVLTETHSVVRVVYPESLNVNVNWFWEKKFNFPISVLWWLKMVSEDVLWCITFFVMAKVSKNISRKFFLIACVYFVYHAIDLFMFLYDYKQTYLVYWLSLAATSAAVIFLIWPIKEKAKIIEM